MQKYCRRGGFQTLGEAVDEMRGIAKLSNGNRASIIEDQQSHLNELKSNNIEYSAVLIIYKYD
ncbi:hypothetical protein GCM10023143_15080 [Compostibacter hankyongensis]|uniref:Uncharacterized protein n=1 Tax=Compostibacter hankyongensis TaxID=1007089 RepID=A0ABP8FP12_9BACT